MALPDDPLWQPPRPSGPARTAELSPRVATVLSALCLGLNNRQIARQLHVTEDTVKTHLRRLYAELGAPGRCAAVALAMSGHVRITVTGGRTPTQHPGRRP